MVAELGTPEIVGATLISFTVTVIGASVLATPSDTRTEKVYVPGPWSSPGVQPNAPVDASIDAPVGPPTRLNASDWAGRSGSVAVAMGGSAVRSSIVAAGGT